MTLFNKILFALTFSTPNSIKHHIHSLFTLREFPNSILPPLFLITDHFIRPNPPYHLPLLPPPNNSNHPRPNRPPNLHRHNAQSPTCSKHQHRLPPFQPRHIHQSTITHRTAYPNRTSTSITPLRRHSAYISLCNADIPRVSTKSGAEDWGAWRK
ncbi:predicted protein [Plenodomus lingam JN3]|uniref:Predicted protein n=1 Tax=Leptosphaeria maculans (strain JN3 / isolate v23.1.3 / race Av1-4-5-6-7-8) TaxID=985895 RepID=E4ZTM3_LEPMJ|nr:predicted protein [Plenodomus lingam JN3]CBX94879.1 predicted protein [Plenodomus lingam JN3]